MEAILLILIISNIVLGVINRKNELGCINFFAAGFVFAVLMFELFF